MTTKNKTTIEDRVTSILEKNAIGNEDGGVKYEDFAKLRDSVIELLKANIKKNEKKWKKKIKKEFDKEIIHYNKVVDFAISEKKTKIGIWYVDELERFVGFYNKLKQKYLNDHKE